MTAAAYQNGSAPIAISAKGLSKHYSLGELASLKKTIKRLIRHDRGWGAPDLAALEGVDFTVYRGDAVGIVGTNGSGKSTLLQILAGTTLPTGGAMEVHGSVVPLLAVGTGFHPDLTGRENVTLFASSLGIPTSVIATRMDAVAAFAEIERHMDTPVKRFSSGMLARLSFAIAMQFPADIYVFDEVLAVVDGEYQQRCLHAIKELHAEGRTVIFVSHSLDQVADVCERIIWLDQGLVHEIGAAEEVLEDYSKALGNAESAR